MFPIPFAEIITFPTARLLGLTLAASRVARAQPTVLNGPPGSGLFGTGVYVLPNGNYVVTEPSFSQGGAVNAGAVYLYRGGDNTRISTLTGSIAGDRVGILGVSILTNGNYVVCSPGWNNSRGAATWGSGAAGITGTVSAANSWPKASIKGAANSYNGHRECRQLTDRR